MKGPVQRGITEVALYKLQSEFRNILSPNITLRRLSLKGFVMKYPY